METLATITGKITSLHRDDYRETIRVTITGPKVRGQETCEATVVVPVAVGETLRIGETVSLAMTASMVAIDS